MSDPHQRPGFSIELRGVRGAVSAAHPLASAAGAAVLGQGGNAVDAAIAAQAVICVVMPNAAGLGGDLLALVHRRDGAVIAFNGTGACAADASPGHWQTGANAVTTPGLVSGWSAMHSRFGRLPLRTLLEPAIQLARDGVVPDDALLASVARQRDRLHAGGADGWDLGNTQSGQVWRQPELSEVLSAVATDGPDAFYRGSAARSVAAAIRRHGGRLDVSDLAAHATDVREPICVGWAGGQVHVQPPISQGVLLAMALNFLEHAHSDPAAALDASEDAALDHLLVELTEVTFEHRSSCARGAGLLNEPLEVDLERAGRRGGPRGYLHTAGVAAADADGLVASSLISVFDDFGSGVFVPELGITLNNRAAGFTDKENSPAPGKKPVHTLAPAMVVGDDVLAIATPGADGQVQTLLQILTAVRYREMRLAEAVSALRWRSESGQLLVEEGHLGIDGLTRRGHLVAERAAGDSLFGGVVAAGYDQDGPFCVSDWRRNVSSSVV